MGGRHCESWAKMSFVLWPITAYCLCKNSLSYTTLPCQDGKPTYLLRKEMAKIIIKAVATVHEKHFLAVIPVCLLPREMGKIATVYSRGNLFHQGRTALNCNFFFLSENCQFHVLQTSEKT